MHSTTIVDHFDQYEDYLFQETIRRIKALPQSPYRDFLIHSKEGQQRLAYTISLLIKAWKGEPTPWFEDQEEIGYVRALQGYKFENRMRPYEIVIDVFLLIVLRILNKENFHPSQLATELQALFKVLLVGYGLTASSFLKTREKQIEEKNQYLNELFTFTRSMISSVSMADISDIILTKVSSLFLAEHNYLIVYREGRTQEIYNHPAGLNDEMIINIMKESWEKEIPIFVGPNGEVHDDLALFQFKRVISVPIHKHGKVGGVIGLSDETKGIHFSSRELELLYSFLYVAALALENTAIIEENRYRNEELSILTRRLITIAEEERKRLAGEVHDGFAQLLISIYYKAQICKELFKNNPDLIPDQLDALIDNVQKGIAQSREIISNLRPDLIDTIGLMPALKRLAKSFQEEKGLTVKLDLHKNIRHIPSNVSICLYRMIQEALMNVYKHAETNTAEVTVRKVNTNVIAVVQDQGRGFNASESSKWVRNEKKLGLLFMKERVEASGGRMIVNAKINAGCQIKAEIPIEFREDPNE